MSEPKRIALIPLAADAVQAPLPATKKDKKSATVIVKTHRFSLTLPDSTEKSCPEFNFADLISSLTVSPFLLLLLFVFQGVRLKSKWKPRKHCFKRFGSHRFVYPDTTQFFTIDMEVSFQRTWTYAAANLYVTGMGEKKSFLKLTAGRHVFIQKG